MTKAQSRRSTRQAGKYKDRFFITARNKARRAATRDRIAKSPAALRRRAARIARNLQRHEKRAKVGG